MKYSLSESNAHLNRIKRGNRIAERWFLFSPLVMIAIGFMIYGTADWPAAATVVIVMIPLWAMLRWTNREQEAAYLRQIMRGRLDGTMDA